MIVLDTNVLSETMRPRPADSVKQWMATQVAVLLYTTAINQAEILYGVALLPAGRRRLALQEAAESIFGQAFLGRVLPFDSAAAISFAQIAATRRRFGRPVSDTDAQIAAIAHSRGAAIATRNVGDFADFGIEVISPWEP
jgi:predicted nucleic acid-binding protein